MENALEKLEGHVVVRLRFANTRSENKSKLAGTGFFVGVHGGDQFFGGTRGHGGRGPMRRTRETMRDTSSAGVRPISWPRRAAAIMPQAIASPCW